MACVLNALRELNFSKVGCISLIDNAPVITVDDPRRDGWVYCWVEAPRDAAPHVLYVGMAGKTLRKRMKEHEGGFKRSATGRAHAEDLRRILSQGGTVEVWARKSETVEVLGRHVCAASVEEAALIEILQPHRNSETKMAKRERKISDHG